MTEKSTGTMQVDVTLVRQLAELLDETKLTEIEVEDGGRKIRVARTVTAAAAPVASFAAAAPAPAASVVSAAPAAPAAAADHPGTIKSPMVGTAYLAPSPEAAPFVTVGSSVAEGDTLLIVEAMKVMNPIAAPRAGKVVKVLVSAGQPVEYDQPLIIVE